MMIRAANALAEVGRVDGLADTPYWTNHQIIETKELPDSMIVLGGGVIGAELGQVMNRFGVKVTLVEALDRLLPRTEPETGQVLADVFEAEGIGVRVGHSATKLGELGIGELGFDPKSRLLTTDDHMRVIGQDGLWAVGDTAGDGLFTHLGVRQATVAAQDILGLDPEPLNLAALAAVTFTDPEVGGVGLTEAEAIDQGLGGTAVVQKVPHTARGWLHTTGNEGVIKLVVDTERDVLVGATSVGPHGGEVLGLLLAFGLPAAACSSDDVGGQLSVRWAALRPTGRLT